MFLRRTVIENPYEKLTEKIKKDLAESLKKKGVNISKISVDMKTDEMNLSMCIKER